MGEYIFTKYIDDANKLKQELKKEVKNFFLDKGYDESELLDTKLDDMFITCFKNNNGYYLIDIQANIRGDDVINLAKRLTPIIQKINPNAKFDPNGIFGKKNSISTIFKEPKFARDSKIKDEDKINLDNLILNGEIVELDLDEAFFDDDINSCTIYFDIREIIAKCIYQPAVNWDHSMYGWDPEYCEDIFEMPTSTIKKVTVPLDNDWTKGEVELSLTEEEKKHIIDLLFEREEFMNKFKEMYYEHAEEEYESRYDMEDSKPIKDDKQTNESIIKFVKQMELSLKGAYSIAKQLKEQLPNQTPTTNEEKELYGSKYVYEFEEICDDLEKHITFAEEYNKELQNAHVVAEDVLEEFPFKARTQLREAQNPKETYEFLLKDLKNRYYSLPDKDKEKYKDQVIKMKKDLDAFYKETFKK